jgi:hypothetical protein
MKIRNFLNKFGISTSDYCETKGVTTQAAYHLFNSDKQVLTKALLEDWLKLIEKNNAVYVVKPPQKILAMKNGEIQYKKSNKKMGRPPKK